MKTVGHFFQHGKKVNILENENGDFYEQLGFNCIAPILLSRGRRLSRRTPENIGWQRKPGQSGYYLPSEVFRNECGLRRERLEAVMEILKKEFDDADKHAAEDIRTHARFFARQEYEEYYRKFVDFWGDEDITLDVFCVTYGSENFLTEKELKTAIKPWHETLVKAYSS